MLTSMGDDPHSHNWTQLRNVLQQYDNPFGDSVYPQSPSSHLRAFHVPEYNSKVAETLRRAVDRFQRPIDAVTGSGFAEHPVSGVLLVLGSRGDGKTHLLHETLLRPDFPAVVIAPSILETHRPFREYLLVQLIDHLQRQPPHRSQLGSLAQWFTRRVLRDAVRAMSEVEWLALDVLRDGGWAYRLQRVLWPKDLELDRQEVMRQLVESELPTIREICEDQRQPWTQVRLAALSHVHRLCPGRTADQFLRRQIYLELVELAFDPDRGSIYDLLVGGSLDAGSLQLELKPSREVLVDTSLGTLLQLFQLHSRPVCFVFDALESLLGIPAQPERCQRFHGDLAHSMDHLPGLSFFIFSETTYWQQIQGYFSEHAVHRFNRGMPTRGGGIEQQLTLERLDAGKLRKIVTARLAPVLAKARRELEDHHISEIAPFEESELSQLLTSGQIVRSAIQALAAIYQQRVFGDALPPPDVAREIWVKELHQARTEVEGNLLQLSEALHGGLNDWLDLLIGSQIAVEGWQLVEAKMLSFGENVRFGQVIKCVWKREAETRDVGLALLLAGGANMMADLRAKLGMMSTRKRLVEKLVILWPRSNELEGAAEDHLPAATKNAWTAAEFKSMTSGINRRVWLRSITKSNLAPWMAWQPALQAIREANAPVNGLSQLVIEQTAAQAATTDLRSYVVPVEPSE